AAEQVAEIQGIDQEMVTHACEQETSMILQVRPELVSMRDARGANIPFNSAFYFPDFHKLSRVDIPRTFDQLSVTGAFGHPEAATAEEGEALFSGAAKEVVAYVREFRNSPAIAAS